MAACVNDPRIEQIARCTDELERCSEFKMELCGPFLGWMDWHAELHRLLYDWEEK
jgi:hypothetical protein